MDRTGMLFKRKKGEDILDSVKAGCDAYAKKFGVRPTKVFVSHRVFSTDLRLDGVEIVEGEGLTKRFIWLGFK